MSFSSEAIALAPAWYGRLGEPSGTTMNDSSGNARHGTYENSAILGATGLLVGDSDTAIAPTVGNGIGIVADAAWMDVTAISLVALIKVTAGSTNRGIISRFTSGGNASFL
ncbi:MAG TPA: hypothetical protein VJ782_01585, partial [Aeromicrobium sp.]|nr:hypothetical protein [Aeromicrobium sp.]